MVPGYSGLGGRHELFEVNLLNNCISLPIWPLCVLRRRRSIDLWLTLDVPPSTSPHRRLDRERARLRRRGARGPRRRRRPRGAMTATARSVTGTPWGAPRSATTCSVWLFSRPFIPVRKNYLARRADAWGLTSKRKVVS